MLPSERSSSSSSSQVTVVRDVDPLLKDLSEKKQSFRKSVVSLAEELKVVRTRLAAQEDSVAKETLTRQEAETKAKNMKEEIDRLQLSLEERNIQLQASSCAAEMYAKELDGLRLQLAATKETADESAQSARSTHIQCAALVEELEKKNLSLAEHEIRVNNLGKQLDLLQKDLHVRESSQTQLKDEVARIEREIMQALATNSTSPDIDLELRKILDETSPKNFESINNLLKVKDDEITRLRDEIRVMSMHWKLKTKELETQLEKHRKNDQELKKKVLKLEFCLHDARAQTRKLQRTGERRDRGIKELKDELAATTKQQNCGNDDDNANSCNNFWESSGFKVVVSVSMLILVMFSKR